MASIQPVPPASEGRLSPEQLDTLSARLAESEDEAEALRLRESITCGFYGV